jgi:hypothetical protein
VIPITRGSDTFSGNGHFDGIFEKVRFYREIYRAEAAFSSIVQAAHPFIDEALLFP